VYGPYQATLYTVERTTNTMTEVLDYDNNGIQISGIFEREDGYYLSGTIFEDENNPTIQKTAAILRSLDEDFAPVDEVILDGSDEDYGFGIALNNQAQPVWFIRSRSIDGPFAAFAASNQIKS
jgi:hypothetical protein